MTPDVFTLTIEEQLEFAIAVQTYEDFIEDNDPHGEHDLGTFEMFGRTWVWKIDCYQKPENWDTAREPDQLNRLEVIGQLVHGAEKPTDPNQTARVLTIMNAAEY